MNQRMNQRKSQRIDIIGAGIAGLSTARALVEAGHSVRVFDPSPPPKPGLDVLVAGIFKPVISTTNTPQTRLSFPALARLNAELDRLGERVPRFSGGLLQCAKSAEEERRFLKAVPLMEPGSCAWIDAREVSTRVGVQTSFGGIYWQRGGWLSPLHLLSAWIDDMEKTGRFEMRAEAYPLDPSHWRSNENSTRDCDAVVVCAGPASRALPDFEPARYQLIRGQISVLDFGSSNFPRAPALPCIAHEYIVPVGAGRFVIGATHDRDDLGTEVRAEDHARLLERFGDFIPTSWRDRPELHRPIFMRAGLRFSTTTRLPYLGPLPATSKVVGKPVYTFTGLGSRGILWSVYLGDTLAGMISGKTPELAPDLLAVLGIQ